MAAFETVGVEPVLLEGQTRMWLEKVTCQAGRYKRQRPTKRTWQGVEREGGKTDGQVRRLREARCRARAAVETQPRRRLASPRPEGTKQ
jgi:hypothetical protein